MNIPLEVSKRYGGPPVKSWWQSATKYDFLSRMRLISCMPQASPQQGVKVLSRKCLIKKCSRAMHDINIHVTIGLYYYKYIMSLTRKVVVWDFTKSEQTCVLLILNYFVVGTLYFRAIPCSNVVLTTTASSMVKSYHMIESSTYSCYRKRSPLVLYRLACFISPVHCCNKLIHATAPSQSKTDKYDTWYVTRLGSGYKIKYILVTLSCCSWHLHRMSQIISTVV